MPEFYIKIKLTQCDTEGPRGEELDEALQDAIDNLDVEGYEVSKSDIRRDDPAKEEKRDEKDNQDNIDMLVEAAVLCQREEFGNLPSKVNDKRTNFQMLAWWVQLFMWQKHSKATDKEFQKKIVPGLPL